MTSPGIDLQSERNLVEAGRRYGVATSLLGAAVLIRQASRFAGQAGQSVATQSVSSGTALAASSVAFLPTYHPEKVWLVEKAAEYERYSNGARILTTHETTNHPRAYHLFARNSRRYLK